MWGLPECLGNGSLWDEVTRPVLVGLSNMHSRLSKIVTSFSATKRKKRTTRIGRST